MLSTGVVMAASTSLRSKAKSQPIISQPDELQSLAIAQGLCADNLAVLKSDILAVPGQIFALDNAVFDDDVFGVPKGILGVEGAVFKNRNLQCTGRNIFPSCAHP